MKLRTLALASLFLILGRFALTHGQGHRRHR